MEVGEPFFEIYPSFTLPKGSPLTQNMSLSVLGMKERHEIISIPRYLDGLSCSSVENPAVGWGKLKYFFYSAYLVLFVAFIFMSTDRRVGNTAGGEEVSAAGGGGQELVAPGERGESGEIRAEEDVVMKV